jgi:4-hydroxyphenylpyruvate dioxygenase
MRCFDIIETVNRLKARGIEFLKIPPAYYENLRKGLGASKTNVTEDLEIIEKL